MSQSEAVVAVTGFGPFRQYLINPSWQAAQHLKMTGLGKGVEVYIKELPVSYVKAQQLVAQIWETVNPKLAVHLGIAPRAKAVTLEQSGKNRGYRDRDACGFCPRGNVCVEGGPDRLDSVTDMKSLARTLKSPSLDVTHSRDAGRYLCDFVYYWSLHLGKGRAVFIHVPASGSGATPEKLVPLLRSIITAMLDQLDASSHPEPDQEHAELVNATPV